MRSKTIRFAGRGAAAGACAAAGLSLAAVLAVSGCASTTGQRKPDKITQELLSTPKETLFAKGKALVEKKKWDAGRKYLNFLFETYPNDPVGRDALLLVADSYVRQGGPASFTEARFRYRDYLNRYPDASRRDYARYQFAYCYDKEHETPDRDQTSTREAIEQYESLSREFPDSPFSGAARERIRQLADLLAEHEFAVGYFYMRKGALTAALGRFNTLEAQFPAYASKDKLLYYSARTLQRIGRPDEAARYYSRVLEEYPKSEFVKKAREGLKKLKVPAATEVKQAGASVKPESVKN